MRRTRIIAFLALSVFAFPAAAGASFTYVPAPAPEASAVSEAAREAASGAPVQAPAELSLPGPSARERAEAEKQLAKAREALRKKEAAAAKRWEAMERKAGRDPVPASAPAPAPVPAPEIMVADNGQSSGTTVNLAPVIGGIKPVGSAPLPGPGVGSASVSAPAAPPFVIGKGSLREQLTRYAEANGYQVSWKCPDDLIVANTTTFAGASFTDNLRDLFTTLQYIGKRDISATLFQGNRTLVVEPSRR